MALINCTECGKEISDQVKTCPNCGVAIKSKINKQDRQKIIKTSLVVIIAVIFIVGWAFTGIQTYNNRLEIERLLKEEESLEGIEQFRIENFILTSEVTSSEYLGDRISWEGSGNIFTNDKENAYFVFLKIILTDGGNANSTKESIQYVIITDGEGDFSTYIYGAQDETTRPTYKFEIIGFIQINTSDFGV